MLCELCGKDVPTTRVAFVERAKVNVCPNCLKFSDGAKSGAPSAGPTAQAIEDRLEKRNRRMQSKDVYAEKDSIRIIDSYGDAIKKARTSKGMDVEQFAASIGEKKGIIAKVESEDLTPDDKLVKKIEKALDISLTEVVQSGGSIGGGRSSGTMTLANFIKTK